jgi:hypothetical protein
MPGIRALVAASVLSVGGVACTSGDTTSGMSLPIECSTQFALTGSFAPNAATPNPDGRACWPIGTWTFTVQMPFSGNTCNPAPTPSTSYVVTGTAMFSADMLEVIGESFTYTTDPNAMTAIKVTEGGTGLCQGSVGVFSTDGKQVWELSPELNADNSITGNGEFRTYTSNQWGL